MVYCGEQMEPSAYDRDLPYMDDKPCDRYLKLLLSEAYLFSLCQLAHW